MIHGFPPASVSLPTVGLWRRSFSERRLAGLADAPRSGRPREIVSLIGAALHARCHARILLNRSDATTADGITDPRS